MLSIRSGPPIAEKQDFVSRFQSGRNHINDLDDFTEVLIQENILDLTAFLEYLYDVIMHLTASICFFSLGMLF
jgi:hypothetical protein